jgi:hypothetical protein
MEKNKNDDKCILAEKIYEKGYNALDLMEYIKDLKINDEKKYEYLVFIQKIKKEFRNEKLLIVTILHFLIRPEYNLENISFM